jgi:hypothetical protein
MKAPPTDPLCPSTAECRHCTVYSWLWFLSCTLSTLFMVPQIDMHLPANQQLGAVLAFGGVYWLLVVTVPRLTWRSPAMRRLLGVSDEP